MRDNVIAFDGCEKAQKPLRGDLCGSGESGRDFLELIGVHDVVVRPLASDLDHKQSIIGIDVLHQVISELDGGKRTF